MCSFQSPTSACTFSGTCGTLRVHLAQNGPSEQYGVCKVGTNAASLTTYLAINAFKPDLVLSAGTAGGFKARGAEIGSVFISNSCLNHDRRIPLPGFKEFGLDKVQTHPMSKVAEELGAFCLLVRDCHPRQAIFAPVDYNCHCCPARIGPVDRR
jgi:5'-methylthioadenosine nucleosidase